MAYPNITINQEADDMGWLEEPYISNKFLERYNKHQKYLKDDDDGQRFVCALNEELPRYLREADLREADLRRADLRRADLTRAIINKVSLLEETDQWQGADFANVRLDEDSDLLTVEQSRKIIIERMIELDISDAKGLGNYWEKYQASLKSEADIQSEPADTSPKSEAETAPTLATQGFKIASTMPNKKQIKKIQDEPLIERELSL